MATTLTVQVMGDLSHSAWGFASVETEEAQLNFRQAVAILYVVEYTTNHLQAVGACFRICDTNECAVWVTASHVVEQAAKVAAQPYLKGHLREWCNKQRLDVAKTDLVPEGVAEVGASYRLSVAAFLKLTTGRL